jgi:hypothetical protein
MLVGAVGIEKSVISKKSRKQWRCSCLYRDNRYKRYKAHFNDSQRLTEAFGTN